MKTIIFTNWNKNKKNDLGTKICRSGSIEIPKINPYSSAPITEIKVTNYSFSFVNLDFHFSIIGYGL